MAIVLLAGLLASTLGCVTRSPDGKGRGVTQKETIRESDAAADEYAVYSALIESMHVRPGIDSVVILNEPNSFIFAKQDLDGTLRFVSNNTPGGIPQDVLADFKAKSRQDGLLLNRFTTAVKCELISKDDVNQLYQNSGWAKFFEKYPHRGVISFSRVGFSNDQNLALAYTGTQSGGKSGWGYYVILTREANRWDIKNKIEVWVS